MDFFLALKPVYLVYLVFCFVCLFEKIVEKLIEETTLKANEAIKKPVPKSTSKTLTPSKTSTKKVGDPRYVIQFPHGKDQTEIKILPLADFKMNVEYPASLELDKALAIAPLAGQRKEPTHLSEKQLQFVMPAKTTEPVELKARLDFSVCNAQACEMVETEVKWTVKPGA
jgi:hypothetical protein